MGVDEVNSTSDQHINSLSDIKDLMIVGESDTSYQFSQNMQSLANIQRVVHVIKAEDGVSLLLQNEYPVIVIDHDADDINSVEFSNIIGKNHSLSRLVVISQDYSSDLIRSLINDASVDAFIPIPLDDFTANSIILEQQAKFEINKMLNQLVKEPPKFSPAYYMLHDPTIQQDLDQNHEFLGCVILNSSVTKYSKFNTDFFGIDEFLISGYLSAITLLGKSLFKKNQIFEEINFGGTSIILHIEEEIQVLLFFHNLTKFNFNKVESKIKSVIGSILQKYGNILVTEFAIDGEITRDINKELEKLYFDQYNKNPSSQTQFVVLFGNQLPKLNVILKDREEISNISRYTNEDDLIDHILNRKTDVLIINQVLLNDEWNFSLASQVKDIKPSVQIIALIRKINLNYLLKILNNEYLDFVISYKDSKKEIESCIDKAFANARSITTNISNNLPHNLQYSVNQSLVNKSLLRDHLSSFEISNIPIFLGIFITEGENPIYSQFYPFSDETNLDFDSQLFAGFINSLFSFSDELFNSNQDFSGFKFGKINIIIRKSFNFMIVYFMSHIDHTNYNIISKQLDGTTEEIVESIINYQLSYAQNKADLEISDLVEQSLFELNSRFVTLNWAEN